MAAPVVYLIHLQDKLGSDHPRGGARHYVGTTIDLDRRLETHRGRPWCPDPGRGQPARYRLRRGQDLARWSRCRAPAQASAQRPAPVPDLRAVAGSDLVSPTPSRRQRLVADVDRVRRYAVAVIADARRGRGAHRGHDLGRDLAVVGRAAPGVGRGSVLADGQLRGPGNCLRPFRLSVHGLGAS